MTKRLALAAVLLAGLGRPVAAKKSWVLVYSKAGQDNGIYALWATDPSHAWALGVESNMGNSTPIALRTTDGLSWNPMSLPSVGGGQFDITLFLSLTFSDEQNGWLYGNKVSMTGADPLLYTSNDGGNSWTQTQSPSFVVDDMQALADGRMFAAGASKVLLADTSGGFQEVELGLAGNLGAVDVYMLNDRCGYVLANSEDKDKSVLLWTEDGGQSWQMRNPLLPIVGQMVWFVDGQTGWLAGSRDSVGLVAWTEDGGQTWQPVSLPDHPPVLGNTPAPMTECDYVRFFDDQRGVAVCLACTANCDSQDDQNRPSFLTGIYWTRDGGRSWELDPDYESAMTDPQFGEMIKFSGLPVAAFPDPNHGFVAGQNNIILRYVAEQPEEDGWSEFPCQKGGPVPEADGGTNPPADCDGADCGGSGADAMRLSGCGCRTTNPASGWLLVLLGALALWRRRRLR